MRERTDTLLRWLRTTLLAVVNLAVAISCTGPLIRTPAPAATRASCYIVCDGQNPATARYEDSNGVLQRCNDARTIYTEQSSGTPPVELRYSRKCRMAWARGYQYIRVEGFNADGSFRVAYEDWPTTGQTGTHFTMAVNDAGLTARACSWNYGSQQYICTPRY